MEPEPLLVRGSDILMRAVKKYREKVLVWQCFYELYLYREI